MRFRAALSGVLAVGLALGLTSFGCGGAQEGSYVPEGSHVEHRQQQSEVLEAPSEPTVPEAIVEKLSGCVRQNVGDLTTYSHETRFDLSLTAEGTISRVKLRSSTLQSGVMESCMMRALVEMSIDPLSLPMRSTKPFSGGERMKHSREHLGVAQALGGFVALGPIMLVAAGVTVGVYVAVVVTEEVIEAAKRKTKREKWCFEQIYRCVGRKNECSACFLECKRHGYWDERKCPLGRSN